MSATGKEYRLAIRIAGTVDKTFNTSLAAAKKNLAGIKTVTDAMDKDFTRLDRGFDTIMSAGVKSFAAVTAAATATATAVGAVTAAAVREGSEFESAFAGVKKTVDATAEEYGQLQNDILEMTRTIPSGASDIAGVMEIAGQLGIAKESLTEFTKTMINMGVSTNLSAEEAATNLAKFANVTSMDTYGADGVSNWERLGSTVVDLGNKFATTEADIVEMSTRLASTGSLVGLTQAQIMALSTAMSSVGIEAEAGGSSMAKLLKKIQIAVETGSGALEDYASVADMTGEQFSRAFGEDAVVALSAFIDGLNDTERNGASAVKILDDMKLSEVRLSNTILALAGAGGVMSDAIGTANSAWNENIALTKEAGERYKTLESRVQIMKNGLSELGITAYGELREPVVGAVEDITGIIHSLNGYLGSADGVGRWVKDISNALPTFQRKAKDAWKTVSPFFDGIRSTGEWCIKHGDGIISIIEGAGAALVTYKIASEVVHIAQALESFTLLNPATPGIMGAVTAIGLLTAAVQTYRKHEQSLVNENLAGHFGSLALSVEELQEAAESILETESLAGVKEALEAFGDLDGISSAIGECVEEINKMNWKVSVGIGLTGDDQEAYKQTIDEYVTAAQEYALQSQYAVSLNIASALGPDNADIADRINGFYADCYDEMTDLGQQLSRAVNMAFSDHILDPDEIAGISEIQAKMAQLQKDMATGEFDAKLSLLKTEYAGGSLTAESFQNLQGVLAEEVEAMTQTYRESYVKALASVNASYKGGALTDEEYETARSGVMQEYLRDTGDAQARSLSFQMETIMEQYADVLDPVMEEYLGNIREIIDRYSGWDWEDELTRADGIYKMTKELAEAGNIDGLDKTTREAIGQLLQLAGSTADLMDDTKQQFAAYGMELTDEMTQALSDYNLLSALAEGIGGDDGAYIIGQEMAAAGLWDGFYDGILSEAADGGFDVFYDIYKEGALDAAATAAAEGMYAWNQETIDRYYAQGFKAEADVNITLNPLYEWKNSVLPGLNGFSRFNITSELSGIKHNANGGIWDQPILTTFAENSPEAAIPIDGSRNAINLWEQTGRLLGMDSVLDGASFEGGSGPVIEYSPVLKFYGDAPSKDDIHDALSISQDEFESLMERYLKGRGRVSFA